MRFLLATPLLAGLAAVVYADECMENYQCMFRHTIGSNTYFWDFSQLCSHDGQYTYDDDSGHTWYFNVCGNATQACTPKFPVYDSFGVAVQMWGGAPNCDDKTCTNYDTGENPVCCTPDCAVVATEFFHFNLIDDTDPSGGVEMVHVGMPPDQADPNQCEIGVFNNLPRERQLTYKFYCDSTMSPSEMTVLSVSEPVNCQYVMEIQTGAACGTLDSSSGGSSDNPGKNFGFTILGAVLCLVVTTGYSFGDRKGYWDGIKSKLPCCRGGSSGGAYTTTTSAPYKNISSSTATPITASAYGTA